MDSERPPSLRGEAHAGSSAITARGTLREALGTLRNLAELLHSVRVAPKSVSRVLPDVLDACAPMRNSVDSLLQGLSRTPTTVGARQALGCFFTPRVAELEAALRAAVARPITARRRLALEDVVARCSFELDAARELLQLLDEAICERTVRVDPSELVRQAFSLPPSARAQGRPLLSAILSCQHSGREIDINPRVVMTLMALGVELVALRPGRDLPHVVISSDAQGACLMRITRRAFATGEPMVMPSRGIVEPTLPCLQAAAHLTGGALEWNVAPEEFVLSYSLVESANQAG